MNAERMRTLGIAVLCCIVLGAGYAFVRTCFEDVWIPRPGVSKAASQNQMLGATRLLEQNHYSVTSVPTLSIALFKPLARGTIILPERGGMMLNDQADRLLNWVAQGNTLIVTPLWSADLGAKRANKLNTGANTSGSNKPGQGGNQDEIDRTDKPAKKTEVDDKDNDGKKNGDKPKDDDDDDDDDEPAAVHGEAPIKVTKSIDARFGVSTTSAWTRDKKICRDPRLEVAASPLQKIEDAQKSEGKFTFVDCTSTATLPGFPHALRIDGQGLRLQSPLDFVEPANPVTTEPTNQSTNESTNASSDTPSKQPVEEAIKGANTGKAISANPSDDEFPKPLFADDQGRALRVFQHGKGKVVFVAKNYFSNEALANYDHAELLLGLADLNHTAPAVMIVERIDIASWYALLWAGIPYAICTVGLFLALLLWSAVRRFGPLIVEPDDRRRSLIEHVDASGRWLWKSEIGRQILLAAVRRNTEKMLERRAPELRKLTSDERIAKLAELCKLKPIDVEQALLNTAARVPAEFTYQIQTLQLLRKQYER